MRAPYRCWLSDSMVPREGPSTAMSSALPSRYATTASARLLRAMPRSAQAPSRQTAPRRIAVAQRVDDVPRQLGICKAANDGVVYMEGVQVERDFRIRQEASGVPAPPLSVRPPGGRARSLRGRTSFPRWQRLRSKARPRAPPKHGGLSRAASPCRFLPLSPHRRTPPSPRTFSGRRREGPARGSTCRPLPCKARARTSRRPGARRLGTAREPPSRCRRRIARRHPSGTS